MQPEIQILPSEPAEFYYVVPANDLFIHCLDLACPCQPSFVVDEGVMVIQHHAADKREVKEVLYGHSLPEKHWIIIHPVTV